MNYKTLNTDGITERFKKWLEDNHTKKTDFGNWFQDILRFLKADGVSDEDISRFEADRKAASNNTPPPSWLEECDPIRHDVMMTLPPFTYNSSFKLAMDITNWFSFVAENEERADEYLAMLKIRLSKRLTPLLRKELESIISSMDNITEASHPEPWGNDYCDEIEISMGEPERDHDINPETMQSIWSNNYGK